ncbi:MAG: tRNA lysidine(34) synthetase TilS [Chloroflexi bacterium]|nr:tRNA lysidine(34) synthetase TilS [Chloroflexota bacterium]
MSLLDTVRATIAQHSLIKPGDAVVVGVSGGADSLTLLDVLRQLRGEMRLTLRVAHLNHLLRGETADADADFVAQLAREWRLPATIEAADVAQIAEERRMSIEEAARVTRYAFLTRVAQAAGAHVIAVAHHADDQVETILLRLLRGTGLMGLRGMEYSLDLTESTFEYRTPGYPLRIVRPLLDVTRAEIETYCQERYLSPRTDETNFDTAIFRNRLRQEALPYLETFNPNLRQVLLRTAQQTADDYAYIQQQVREAYAQVASASEDAIMFDRDLWSALPISLQRGTLREAIFELRRSLKDIEWAHIENARCIALDKDTGAEATLPHNLVLVLGYNEFAIRDTTKRSPIPDLPLLHVERLDLPVAGTFDLPNTHWMVETELIDAVEVIDNWTALLDFEKCQGAVYLRCRRPGDRFQPAGMKGKTKTLNEFMINEKIPAVIRDRLPILVVNDHIGWVCGWRTDERVRAVYETKAVWRVRFIKKDA